jgi:hypothetical protein
MLVSNSLIVYAFVLGSAEEAGSSPIASLAIGLALVPIVFLLLAFISRHPRAPTGVLYAMLLSLMVGIPLAAFDVAAALTMGFGAGGAVALAKYEEDSWIARAIAVVVVTVYIVVLLRYQIGAALLATAILPLVAIGSADEVMEWRAARREHLDED